MRRLLLPFALILFAPAVQAQARQGPPIGAGAVKVAVDLRAEVDVNIGATWFRGGGDSECGGNRPEKEDKAQGTKTASGDMRIDPLPTDEASRAFVAQMQEHERTSAQSVSGHVKHLHESFGWVTSPASTLYADIQRVVREVESPATEGGREWLADAKAGHGGSAGSAYRQLKAWMKDFESSVPAGYRIGTRLPNADLTTDFGLGWQSYSPRRTSVTGSVRREAEVNDVVSVTIDDWLNPEEGDLKHSNDCGHIAGKATPSADRLVGTVTVTYTPGPNVPAVIVDATVNGMFENRLDFPDPAESPVTVAGGLHDLGRDVPRKYVLWRRATDGPIVQTFRLRHSRGRSAASASLQSTLNVRFEPLGVRPFKGMKASDLRREIQRLVDTDATARTPDRLLDLLVALVAQPQLVDPLVSALTPAQIYALSDDLFRFEMSMSLDNPNLTLDTKVATRLVGFQVARRALTRFSPLCGSITLPLPFGHTHNRRISGVFYSVLSEARDFVAAVDTDPVVRFATESRRPDSAANAEPVSGSSHEAVIRSLAASPDGLETLNEQIATLVAVLAKSGDPLGMRRLSTSLTQASDAYRQLSRAVVRAIAAIENGTSDSEAKAAVREPLATFRKASAAARVIVAELLRRTGFDEMVPDDLATRAIILDAHILNLLEPDLDKYLEPVRAAFVSSEVLQTLRRQAATCGAVGIK